MRRDFLVTVLALAALAATPGESAAFGRRGRMVRCQPVYPAPVVSYAPGCGPIIYSPHGLYAPLTLGPQRVVTGPEAAEEVATVTIKGKRYRILDSKDPGDEKEDEVTKAATPSATTPSTDVFRGTSRRVAKTTLFPGPRSGDFATLADLLDSLEDNDTMRSKNISRAPTSERVDEEKKNVRVKAFIYAYKKEPDNDYHVILGDAPGTPNMRYMNVEISGIPIGGTDANRDQLWAARKAFKEGFNLGASGPRRYFKPDPPVPVRVSGSLFWDVDHENPPFVGPASHKPKTPWEIHPISEIEFLDE